MKIVVTGTRGIPNIQGGVETHCQELYPRLAKYGLDITIVRRNCYVINNNRIPSFDGITLKDIYAPRKRSIEAIVHSFLAVLYAKKKHADIIHIHNIGPAIWTPFARFLGLKVIVTYHSQNYLHKKWSKFAKFILKIGEKFTIKYANEVIVISEVIQSSIRKSYGQRQNMHLIPNGVNIPQKSNSTNYIKSIGLIKDKYIVALGRFVEEKGFHNLINAYSESNIKNDYKLVIAGDSDHEDKYSLYLKNIAKENNVILTGFIKGNVLNELLSHAALFVLPSFHEGLPISLLEAMSYNLNVLVSAIPSNLEIGLNENDYFNPNSTIELKNKLNYKLQRNKEVKNYDLSKYDWIKVAKQTLNVYTKTIDKR